MENRINTYGYAVFGNGKMPLYIVQINHNMLSAFSVFCSAKNADFYISAPTAPILVSIWENGKANILGIVMPFRIMDRCFSA